MLYQKSICLFSIYFFALGGCVMNSNARSGTGLYLGAIYFSESSSSDNSIELSHVKSLGVWAEQNSNIRSLGAGLKISKNLAVGLDCQIAFIIETMEDAELAVELITSTLGEESEICVEKF